MRDLIERKAAIEAIRKHEVDITAYTPRETDIFWDDVIDCCIDELEQLPSAQPERWIPCSERLPEEADYNGYSECIDGAVWYYTDKGEMRLGYYYESTKAWSTTYDECPYGEVIAWMPLPEPYAERREK